MKLLALVIATMAFIACNNSQSGPSLVKSADTKSNETANPKNIEMPVARYGIEGFYTGAFTATKYDEGKESFDNKITICIDSLNEKNIYGRSIVAGNDRPFTGTYSKDKDGFSISVKEPGDNKYDGNFDFVIDPVNKKAKGLWRAYDKKLPVTEREYDLQLQAFKYDPSLDLTDDIIGASLYGTYNENAATAEAVTEDVLKLNASKILLKSKDVENMYKADLEVLRNAIYARHGYSFKNRRMRLLFDNYVPWYMPLSTDVAAQLTEIEKQNIALLKRYEAHATKYYDDFGR